VQHAALEAEVEGLKLQLQMMSSTATANGSAHTRGTPRAQLRVRIDMAQERAAAEHKLRLHAERRMEAVGGSGAYSAEAINYLAQSNGISPAHPALCLTSLLSEALQEKTVLLEAQIKKAAKNPLSKPVGAASRVRRKKPSFDAESSTTGLPARVADGASSGVVNAECMSGKSQAAVIADTERRHT
jgi:hypothetical protein